MGDLKKLLSQDINWTLTKDVDHPFSATLDGVKLVIRVNDFPEEELYSLIAGEDVISFSDWPKSWERSVKVAAKPKVRSAKSTTSKVEEQLKKFGRGKRLAERRRKRLALLRQTSKQEIEVWVAGKVVVPELGTKGIAKRRVSGTKRASITRSSSRQISKSPDA